MDIETRLRSLYEAFNARDIDATLAAMGEDVDWPNGWEGGREQGHEALRAYWTRQWAEVDPHVEPVSITIRPDGRVAVEVRQVVRDLRGDVLMDGRVVHVYETQDDIVVRMEIEEPK